MAIPTQVETLPTGLGEIATFIVRAGTCLETVKRHMGSLNQFISYHLSYACSGDFALSLTAVISAVLNSFLGLMRLGIEPVSTVSSADVADHESAG